mgnify:CR=1 FL=1
MAKSGLNICLIGLGSVGGGVARLLQDEAARMTQRAGGALTLRRVVVRDPSRARAVSVPSHLLSTDAAAAIRDPEVDVVVELMGGIEPARSLILDALKNGKDVVTANKALLCAHGDEIFRAAREKGRCVAFEASVAGGIPIVATVGQSLAGNQIQSIEAILNGTSNFILTEMLAKRCAYSEVLSRAQQLGYAEADPAMDVDGTDAAQKLVILTQMAFGQRIGLDEFVRQWIDTLELADLLYADELGYAVKLLAVSQLVEGRLEMHVQATLVHKDKPMAQVNGAYNMIRLVGDAVGSLWLSGAGAGSLPTASAVLADLIDVATQRAAQTFPRLDLWKTSRDLEVQPAEETTRRYYLRFNAEDRPHVFAEFCDILGRHKISLASIIQHEAPEWDDANGADGSQRPTVPAVLMTHRATEGQMRAADAELDRLSSIRPPRVRMPVAD